MIDDYQEQNVEETLAAARQLDDDRLADFVQFERDHKDRTTVIEPLERQLVDVTPVGQQYAAGLWFDDISEVRTVRRSRRVEQAIEAGRLEVV